METNTPPPSSAEPFLGGERYLHHTFKNSQTLAYCKYDTVCSLLLVIFHNGSEYEYPGITQATYDELIAAPSAGSWFNLFMRKHKCQRVR